jgi:hypothetical protein
MTTEKRLYQVTKELPESMLSEILDFAEFLKQKKSIGKKQIGNIAQRIHRRFKNLEGEGLPIPERQLSRMPPQWDR